MTWVDIFDILIGVFLGAVVGGLSAWIIAMVGWLLFGDR